MSICKEFRSFLSCDGALIERDGVTLCAAHYRAQYVRELLKKEGEVK
jgi:hypothetical protein